MSNTGARPALIGFRRQFLYVTHRLLTEPNIRIRLEDREDFHVVSETGAPLEVVQVKSLSHNLKFSDLFSSTDDGGFFRRTQRLLKHHPKAQAQVASYGPIGPELATAWAGPSKERDAVLEKLDKAGFSHAESGLLFKQVTIVQLNEMSLLAEIRDQLAKLATGHDLSAAFDLLMYWTWIGSEQSSLITRDLLERKLMDIGVYVAGRDSIVTEWFRTIVPLLSSRLETQQAADLTTEFEAGVAARFEHICLRLDIPRERPAREISEQFAKQKIVVIRGASGQGKSTVAYRWLHDNVPEMQRLEITHIRDRYHARNIIFALESFLSFTKSSACVFVDVRPGDDAWLELLSPSVRLSNIKFLIAIREEDWRRAESALPSLSFGEISLDLSEAEARRIYELASIRKELPNFADFEDAWRRFGEGPLLEFTFLLNQSILLRQRLAQQLAALRSKGQPDSVKLLRLGVHADAYGARLEMTRVAAHLPFSDLGHAMHVLEKEYLLRQDDEKRYVHGVHPVRSTILMDLFEEQDAGIHPWNMVAKQLLPVIEESDLEIFLLCSFSRRHADRPWVVSALMNFSPASWPGCLGVTRALLWLGIASYLEANETVVDEAYARYREGWWIHLAQDVVEMDKVGVGPSMADSAAQIVEMAPESTRMHSEELRAKLLPVDQVKSTARNWLSNATLPSGILPASNDLASAGELLFWQAHWSIQSWFLANSANIQIPQAEVDIDALGNIIVAAWRAGQLPLVSAIQNHALTLFENKPDVLELVDDGQSVHVSYIVSILELMEPTTKDSYRYIHSLALRNCQTARSLLPDREKFRCKGYGHGHLQIDPDPSEKTGIPAELLPPQYLSRYNAVYTNLGSYKHRVATWKDWRATILEHRKNACDVAAQVLSEVETYFRRGRPKALTGSFLHVFHGEDQSLTYSQPPAFPKCAVDEWGFTREDGGAQGAPAKKSTKTQMLRTSHELVPLEEAALPRMIGIRDRHRDFFRPLTNFFRQMMVPCVVCPAIGEAGGGGGRRSVESKAQAQGMNIALVRLSFVNLSDAVAHLDTMHAAFRELPPYEQEVSSLYSLERREAGVYADLLNLWYEFVARPEKVGRSRKAITAEQTKWWDGIKRNVRQLARSIGLEISTVTDAVSRNKRRSLWVVFSVSHFAHVDDGLADLKQAIHQALPKVGSQALFWINALIGSIELVPLVRGRSVFNFTFSIHINSNASDPESMHSFFPITARHVEELGLDVQRGHLLVAAENVVKASQRLWSHIRHEVELEPFVSSREECSYCEDLLIHEIDCLNGLGSSLREFNHLLMELEEATEHSARPKSLCDLLDITSDPHERLEFPMAADGAETGIEDWGPRFAHSGIAEELVMHAAMYEVEAAEMRDASIKLNE